MSDLEKPLTEATGDGDDDDKDKAASPIPFVDTEHVECMRKPASPGDHALATTIGSCGSQVIAASVVFSDGSCGSHEVAASDVIGKGMTKGDEEAEYDLASVVSAPSTLGVGTDRTQRRALQRKSKKKQGLLDETVSTANAGTGAGQTTSRDVAVQCDLRQNDDTSKIVSQLEAQVTLLEARLAHQELKSLTWKGKYQSLKRLSGEDSDWDTDEDVEAQSDGTEEFQPSMLAAPSHDMVSVGDIAVVRGLSTGRGLDFNGHYGKVLSWDVASKRFAVRVKGEQLAIKPENLGLGMKGGENSVTDEEFLLSLKPTAPEVQAMPWLERRKYFGFDGI